MFGRKPKAKDNTGRSTKVTSIMISKDLKDRLSELKDAYECCYNETVTYDQMLTRWADNVGRFDPKVPGCLKAIREERKKEQERLAAGLGLTAEQLTANEAAFDPTSIEHEPWKLRYFFEKDGEQVDAIPALSENPTFGNRFLIPFYAVMDGEEVMMKTMIRNGWTLMNELGCEIDIDQAQKICNLMK